jgi:hypothetical protein
MMDSSLVGEYAHTDAVGEHSNATRRVRRRRLERTADFGPGKANQECKAQLKIQNGRILEPMNLGYKIMKRAKSLKKRSWEHIENKELANAIFKKEAENVLKTRVVTKFCRRRRNRGILRSKDQG